MQKNMIKTAMLNHVTCQSSIQNKHTNKERESPDIQVELDILFQVTQIETESPDIQVELDNIVSSKRPSKRLTRPPHIVILAR